MEDLSGQTIKGYEVREQIGAGGFGAVYRARQSTVNREVAIKVIKPRYANNPEFIRRFESEAQLVARLEHPHIVPLYDYWRVENAAYLVMRWVSGGSLRQMIDTKGACDPETAARLLDQIAAALAFAHRHQVIHRDLKPDNILLDEDGNAYLSDFGIAKDLLNVDTDGTQEGMIVGSPAYISPEQSRGDPITARSDIYSLGIVLYEILTGKHPFPGSSTITLMIKHRTMPLPPLEHLPPPISSTLDMVIQRATAKEADERYEDVLGLATAFRRAISKTDNTSDSTATQRITPLHIGDLHARLYTKAELILEKPRRLIGRDAQKTQVLELLDDQERVLLHGLGGMGKTALAATVAAEWIDAGKGMVIWLEAGSHRVDVLFEAIARTFDEQHHIVGKRSDDRVTAMREIFLDKNSLLVLDNAWNEQALFQMIRAIPPTMPLLITSRHAIPLDGIVLDIEALSTAQALELMGYHARKDYTDSDKALELCSLLGNHPFALEIAGKRLKVTRSLTPEQLLHNIANTPHELAVPGDFADIGRRGIKDLLDESVRELTPEARAVFTTMGGMFAPVASIELLSLVVNTDALDTIVDELERRGLIEMKAEPMRHYRMHDLTYSYAHALFKEQQDYQIIIDAIQRFVDEQDINALDFEQNNILAATKIASSSTLINIMKTLTLGGYFAARGHTPLFLEQLDLAIKAARQIKQPDTDTLHHLLSKRGNAHADRGEYDNAILVYKEAFEFAPNPTRQAILLSVIGSTYFRNGDNVNCDTYLEEALQTARQSQDDIALAFVLSHRGTISLMQEDYATGLPFLQESVEIAERMGNPARLFEALQNLGAIQEGLGQISEALALHQRAYQIAQEVGNHRYEAVALHSIGMDYHALGQREQAREYLNKALRSYRTVGFTVKIEELSQFMQQEGYEEETT